VIGLDAKVWGGGGGRD